MVPRCLRARPLLMVAALAVLTACAPAGHFPHQPFEDVPVPAGWVPYSRDAAIVRSPKVTAAKLIYLSPAGVDASLEEARRLLLDRGWRETRSERFVNPERFPGVWAEFAKSEDVCRVTVIEGAQGTHVDYTLARRAPAR